MRTCKECGCQVTAKDPRTIFCSVSCSGSWNGRRRVMTELTRARISISLKKLYQNGERSRITTDQASRIGRKATMGKFGDPKNILDMSKRTMVKIFKRLDIGCSRCGWKETICDVHHIWGRKIANANDHDKLSYLCPNCHRLAQTGIIKPEELVTLSKQIGERWRDLYFGSEEGKRLLLAV